MGNRHVIHSKARFSRLQMKKLIGAFASFASDESGQAISEYLILISAILGASITLSRNVLKGINQGILSLGSVLERDLKTGRASVHIWKN